MKVLMLVWTSVTTDTRVLREARTLVAAGHRVHIIGRAIPASFEPPSGVTLSSVGQPPLSQGRTRRLSMPERMVRWALLPQHVARRLRAWQTAALDVARDWAAVAGPSDVVHAHDFTALGVGSTLAQTWGVPLVYDTHEYWVGRPREGRPAPIGRWIERRSEGALGSRAAAVITVGDGVAAQLTADHPDWPDITVVRNTFPVGELDRTPGARPTSYLYAGRLAADRELEVIAQASGQLELPVTLRGPADDAWLNSFEPGAALVAPPLPILELDGQLCAAGVALVTHSDRWANHRLALPNKLFHAVSLGVPVVATDVGELGELVRAHDLGTLYRPGDVADFIRAGGEVLDRYDHFTERVLAARAELSWPTDAARLLALYDELGRSARPLD